MLIGGLRSLNANFDHSAHGVFTKRPETLSNDFFVNLLDMNTKWTKSAAGRGCAGRAVTVRRANSNGRGTIVDLVFGSNSQLRALAEVYASSDSQPVFRTRTL